VTTATQSEMRDNIRAALNGGRYDQAKSLLAVALDRWPGAYGFLVLRAEVLGTSGEITSALEDLRAIHKRFPDDHLAALGMTRLLLEADRLAEARAVFQDDVWPVAAPEASKSEFINALAPRHGNLDETVDFLERLDSARPGNLAVLIRLAVIRSRQGLWEESLGLFDKVAAADPLPEYAQAIRADLLLACGRMPESLALARELAADNPHRVDHTHRLILTLSGSSAHHEAATILKDAAVKWPNEWRLLLRLNRIVPVQPLWDEAFDVFESGFNAAKADHRALFQFALASLRQGKTEQALSALATNPQRGPAGHMWESLERVLRKISPEEWRARMRLADDQSAEVQIVDVEAADTTIMVFGGVDGGFSNLPFGHTDALLSAYRANVVYLRDFNFRAFFEGVSSLGSTVAETLDRLRGILERLATRRLITMGNSVGGFAAIRYGVRLGAHAAVSFGAPTTLDGEFQAEAKPGVGYSQAALKRALSFRLPEEKDLVHDLAGTTETRVFHYYGALYPAESAHADRFRGLHNVELRPQNISDHSVALCAIADDTLDRLVVEELGVPRD